MVSKFSVMLVAFVKCMFHNNLIDGPTVQPLYVKSKKQTFCECDGPGKRRFVSFDLGGHDAVTANCQISAVVVAAVILNRQHRVWFICSFVFK
jgi:hypothetical protein